MRNALYLALALSLLAAPVQAGMFLPPVAGQVRGTATNDNAAAGNVGEFITNNASGVALTNGANANVTSISLTAGDWDVTGSVNYSPSAATISSTTSCIGTTTATCNITGAVSEISTVLNGTIGSAFPIIPIRISISATTTVFLVAEMNFSAGTVNAGGYIGARRAR